MKNFFTSKKLASFMKGLFISMGGAAVAYASGFVEASSLEPMYVALFSNVLNLVNVTFFKSNK